MKKIYSLVILLTISSISFGQFWHQQYFDGADTSLNNSIIIKLDTLSTNIWQIGKPQKTIFHKASTVPNVIVTDTIHYYPVNNVSRFTFDFTSPVSYGVLALQWMQKLDMDKHKDGGIIEFSSDSGHTWVNIFNNHTTIMNFYGYQPANADTLTTSGEYAFSGTDTTWRNVWVCFNYAYLQTHQYTKFRFTLKSDSVNNNKEGWMIDNMMLNITMIHPVNEMKKIEYLKVFPTVTNDLVNIESRNNKDVSIIRSMVLESVDGKVLERFTNIPANYNLSMGKYSAGLYFLKITTDFRTENHPIMVNKN